jgi:hypothetical protein
MVIVSVSGGASSAVALHRAVLKYGAQEVWPVFMDTKSEDPDLYRFLDDVDHALGVKTLHISDGRDVWQVAKDARFVPNSRVDVCSRVLKRELFDALWALFGGATGDMVAYGFHAGEIARVERLRVRAEAKGITPWFPLLDEPEVFSEDALRMVLFDLEVRPPRLYSHGFVHNNCGGFCFKAGQAQFAKLLDFDRDLYLHHEGKEREMQEFLGKNVTILRQQRKGVKYRLSLRQLREQLDGGRGCDMTDVGAPCDCMGIDNDE